MYIQCVCDVHLFQIHECYQTLYREVEAINSTALHADEEELMHMVRHSLTADLLRLAEEESAANGGGLEGNLHEPGVGMLPETECSTCHAGHAGMQHSNPYKALCTHGSPFSSRDQVCVASLFSNEWVWLESVLLDVVRWMGVKSRSDSVVLEMIDLVTVAVSLAVLSVVVSVTCCVTTCVYLIRHKKGN